jgi:hypothetical protein
MNMSRFIPSQMESSYYVRYILHVLLGTATAIMCLLATPVRAYESRITAHPVTSYASGCVVPLSFTSTPSLQPQYNHNLQMVRQQTITPMR